MRVVAVGHPVDELIRASLCADLFAFLQRGVFIAPAQVFQNRAGEQHVLLQHHSNLIAQGFHVVLAHVHAADFH